MCFCKVFFPALPYTSYESYTMFIANINYLVFQHDLTPRIYVLHKITIALKFMSYINQKLRPSYQTALNLCLT